MIDFRTLLLVPALGLGASVLAQAPTSPTPKPSAGNPEAAAPEVGKNIEHLIQQLGSDSYRSRLQAERELKQLGKAAEPALGKAADDSSDGEVQWRARRLLRQMENSGDGGIVERRSDNGAQSGADPEVDTKGNSGSMPRLPGRAGAEMRSQFESLFQHMEHDFGLDIPRGRFFQDDFFQDLQNQIKAGQGSSQGMTMQVGPNGVRVEVQQKNEKGETEKKVYEAPDLDTFNKQYPDVLRQNGLGMGLNPMRMPTLRNFGFNTPATPRWLPAEPPTAQPATPNMVPPVGRRLGVTVRPEVSADLREYLGLDDGEGLMVDGVQGGSLAEALGLEAGDIITKIGDTTIGAPADVQKALGTVGKGDQVHVQFVRKGDQKTASAAKTEDDEAEKPGKAVPRHDKASSQIR